MDGVFAVWTIVRGQAPAGRRAAVLVGAASDDVIDDDVIGAPPGVLGGGAHAQVRGADYRKSPRPGGKSAARAGESVGLVVAAVEGVGEVGVRVVLARQSDVTPAAPGREQLALLAVAPLHPPVLEPDLHLRTKHKAPHFRATGK